MAPTACTSPPAFPNCVGGMRHRASTRHPHICRQQHLMLGKDVISPADLPGPHCLPGAQSSKLVRRKGGGLHVGGGCPCQRPAISLIHSLVWDVCIIKWQWEAASLMTCHHTGPRSEHHSIKSCISGHHGQYPVKFEWPSRISHSPAFNELN